MKNERHFEVVCDRCTSRENVSALRCTACGGSLSFRYRRDTVTWDGEQAGIWRYWPLLPVRDLSSLVSLGEGGTPLLRSAAYPDRQIYLKDEMRNPTGSHKDRQLCVAITHARTLGRRTSVLVSAGSTGIAHAAYTSRAGLHSIVLMSEGVPAERAFPAFALGSMIIEVRGDIDKLMDRVNALAAERGLYHSSTARAYNPYQAEGAKTIAFEIVEQLGGAPDWVVVPVGGGGTLAAVWRGMTELHERSMIDRLPRMVGVTAQRWNALVRASRAGYSTQEELRTIPDEGGPASVQVKLAHAHPPDGADALAAVRDSNGQFISASDDQALRAVSECGMKEGLYVEPSTGTALAGLETMVSDQTIGVHDVVVVLLCGSGFRETAPMMEFHPLSRETIDLADVDDVLSEAPI